MPMFRPLAPSLNARQISEGVELVRHDCETSRGTDAPKGLHWEGTQSNRSTWLVFETNKHVVITHHFKKPIYSISICTCGKMCTSERGDWRCSLLSAITIVHLFSPQLPRVAPLACCKSKPVLDRMFPVAAKYLKTTPGKRFDFLSSSQ